MPRCIREALETQLKNSDDGGMTILDKVAGEIEDLYNVSLALLCIHLLLSAILPCSSTCKLSRLNPRMASKAIQNSVVRLSRHP